MFRAVIFAMLCILPIYEAKADLTGTIRALAPSGLIHVENEAGETLVSQNAGQPFVPASVAKIATAWLAMEVLGGDYRFETGFYIDAERVLYVRGGGDPFLVSEELALIADRLINATGIEQFSAMVLDTSYFPEDIAIPGIDDDNESYNAVNSALAANFNTIHAVRTGSTVRSAEEQTPITPLAISQFRQRGPEGRARISLAQEEPALSALYAGELLAEFIRQSGGNVNGDMTLGPVPTNLEPVYIHRQSRPLSEIVHLLLIGSNNYIANQIFLEVGAQDARAQVSLEKSQDVLGELLAKHNLSDVISLVEGSGISRQNQMTAQGLTALLTQFAPHAELMSRSESGSRYKTGTLDDVSTLAGYAQTKENGVVRFVIGLPGGSGQLRFSILEAIENGL